MGGQNTTADRGRKTPVETEHTDRTRISHLQAGPHAPRSGAVEEQSRLDLGGFGEGTLIDTASGPWPIEHLQPGDLIRTAEFGLIPVQYNWAIPEDAAPQTLFRLRNSGSQGGASLYALPTQCLRLTHWLCQRLFQAEAVLLRLGDLGQPGPADPVARHDRQIYRLELGVTCGITANGQAVGSLSARQPVPGPIADPGSGAGPASLAPLRLLAADDARFLMASTSITRPRGGRR